MSPTRTLSAPATPSTPTQQSFDAPEQSLETPDVPNTAVLVPSVAEFQNMNQILDGEVEPEDVSKNISSKEQKLKNTELRLL